MRLTMWDRLEVTGTPLGVVPHPVWGIFLPGVHWLTPKGQQERRMRCRRDGFAVVARIDSITVCRYYRIAPGES